VLVAPAHAVLGCCLLGWSSQQRTPLGYDTCRDSAVDSFAAVETEIGAEIGPVMAAVHHIAVGAQGFVNTGKYHWMALGSDLSHLWSLAAGLYCRRGGGQNGYRQTYGARPLWGYRYQSQAKRHPMKAKSCR